MLPNDNGPDWSHYQEFTGQPFPSHWSMYSYKCSEGIKSGDGKPEVDRFAQRWEMFRDLGVKYRGAYHVLLGGVSVKDQAANFCKRLDAQGGLLKGEFGQNDWENWKTGLATSDAVTEFNDRVEQHYGRQCMITYSGAFLGDSQYDVDVIPEFAEWREANPTAPWWLANYRTGTSLPRDGWNVAAKYTADVWQWSSTFVHPSVVGGFDINHVFNFNTLDIITDQVPIHQEEETMTVVYIRPKNPAFEFEPGKFGIFTEDGHPVTQQVIDAHTVAGDKVVIVDQDAHRWWDEATLHRMGELARRAYGDTPQD